MTARVRRSRPDPSQLGTCQTQLRRFPSTCSLDPWLQPANSYYVRLGVRAVTCTCVHVEPCTECRTGTQADVRQSLVQLIWCIHLQVVKWCCSATRCMLGAWLGSRSAQLCFHTSRGKTSSLSASTNVKFMILLISEGCEWLVTGTACAVGQTSPTDLSTLSMHRYA